MLLYRIYIDLKMLHISLEIRNGDIGMITFYKLNLQLTQLLLQKIKKRGHQFTTLNKESQLIEI